MTDNATVIRTEISRPAPEIVKGFLALATTAVSDFLVMLAGIYYPVSVLPGWAQTVSAFIPLTYFLDAFRAGYGFEPAFAHPALMGFALSGLYLVLGHWALAAALTRSRRTDLLLKLSE